MSVQDRNKKLDCLDTEGVVKLLQTWDLVEFVDFVKEKQLDGRKIADVTEGIVKLWRPQSNAKKFIAFLEDLKRDPDKYLITNESIDEKSEAEMALIESQYQTVKKKGTEELVNVNNSIEDLLKKWVPVKSFLYRNQPKQINKAAPSYLPMKPVSPKRSKKFFRLNSYEYPLFDLRSRLKQDTTDKYYPMKRTSIFYINKLYKRPEWGTKYKSISTTEEFTDKYAEDHLYEDLNYNEIPENTKNFVRDDRISSCNLNQTSKPCMVKIQELIQSFRMPFFGGKKTDPLNDVGCAVENGVDDKETNIYESNDPMANMYDSVHVNNENVIANQSVKTKLPVEDYLDPVQINKDYLDVQYKQKDDSILGYIMSIFENRFGMKRDTNDARSEGSDNGSEGDVAQHAQKPEDRKSRKMADRPLPVPIENEPFYMNIDRTEAESLLKGQPDGMFVLRPSSQPNHAYTLSVSCTGAVHNVGVRRRQDGRLALGFARRGERSFTSVASLLRHHRRRRLLLVAEGGVIGATTLIDTPQYYQTPRSIPIPI
ncbi:uncharacterized protein LOC101739712 [Bombyx mori]|uniref:SH2 domain-containing protein n=2 Tax=Bombyx mori TaxID=7091 RepID=A0A8R1WEC3_BOMMO|nr:uncharacterized protein LOC101739712 isoform X1 [Bombyx mori]